MWRKSTWLEEAAWHSLKCLSECGKLGKPDPLSEAFYVGMINNRTYTQESITVMAVNLDLNKGNVNIVGLNQTGVEYVPPLF
jgi:hypothetical protein